MWCVHVLTQVYVVCTCVNASVCDVYMSLLATNILIVLVIVGRFLAILSIF